MRLGMWSNFCGEKKWVYPLTKSAVLNPLRKKAKGQPSYGTRTSIVELVFNSSQQVPTKKEEKKTTPSAPLLWSLIPSELILTMTDGRDDSLHSIISKIRFNQNSRESKEFRRSNVFFKASSIPPHPSGCKTSKPWVRLKSF